jgi:hypothetical protein
LGNTFFFGLAFGFGGGAMTTAGFCAGGSLGTAIAPGGLTSSGWASVIFGPSTASGGTSDAGATSIAGRSIITTAGGVPAALTSRLCMSHKIRAAWKAVTTAAQISHRRSSGSCSGSKKDFAAAVMA